MAERSKSLIVMFLTGAATAFGAGSSEVSFDDLKGTYLSSMHGGCSLELDRDATYVLSCASQRPQRGEAFAMAGGFIISTGRADFGMGVVDRTGEIHIPAPPQPPAGTSQWPPSTQDPTSGPYVIAGEDPAVFFQPFRWGSRLYLIPGGDETAFCRAVRSGAEPRTKSAGKFFLRRGDHRKRAGPRAPEKCADLLPEGPIL